MYLYNIKNNRKQINNFDWCQLNMGCITHLLLMGNEVVTHSYILLEVEVEINKYIHKYMFSCTLEVACDL